MGWVWRNEGDDVVYYPRSGGAANSTNTGTTLEVVRSQCRTEEVEPGKFVKKCESTEEILRYSLGKPTEVLKSDKVYTEEDVTDMIVKASVPFGKVQDSPFNFPGLRSDIADIERHFLGSISRFFYAADE